jgi:hypothetical protein
MLLKRARESILQLLEPGKHLFNGVETQSLHLGIEAIKEVQYLRRTPGAKVSAKLPGEDLE